MIPAGTEQGTRGDSRAAGISKGEMSLTAGGIQGDFAVSVAEPSQERNFPDLLIKSHSASLIHQLTEPKYK